MKIYAISTADYDSYEIHGVYTTREKARAALREAMQYRADEVQELADGIRDEYETESEVQAESEACHPLPRVEVWDVDAPASRSGTNATQYVDLAELGWTADDAVRIRGQVQTFADDWDDSAMDVYDKPGRPT